MIASPVTAASSHLQLLRSSPAENVKPARVGPAGATGPGTCTIDRPNIRGLLDLLARQQTSAAVLHEQFLALADGPLRQAAWDGFCALKDAIRVSTRDMADLGCLLHVVVV